MGGGGGVKPPYVMLAAATDNCKNLPNLGKFSPRYHLIVNSAQNYVVAGSPEVEIVPRARMQHLRQEV